MLSGPLLDSELVGGQASSLLSHALLTPSSSFPQVTEMFPPTHPLPKVAKLVLLIQIIISS